jgi:hypothetical protein
MSLFLCTVLFRHVLEGCFSLTVFYNSDVQNPAGLFENPKCSARSLRDVARHLAAFILVKIKGMALFLL